MSTTGSFALINMAGGKRKFLNKKTRNKRQNETENTEENPPVRSLRDSSAQGKKPKLEETKENEEKRPLSVEVDLTTEPTTSIKPKLKDDDVSKKANKYVPPFSRTRKSGNVEEKSGSKSPVTRSSTRKRNLLQVLADVAKHKLELEDGNDETSSLLRSEKRDPSNKNEEEQEEIVETPPAKLPKLRERTRINRQFSLNLRDKGKKKTKQSERKSEGKGKLDENISLAKTLEEYERQDTKAVEIYDKEKYQQTTEEALKDEAKQIESEQEVEEVDRDITMAETLGDNDIQEAKNVEKYNEDKHYKTAEEALKDEAKQSENEQEGEEVDGHTTIAETLGENDSQKAKNVEKYNEDKHYKTAEEALKDEAKQSENEQEGEEVDGHTTIAETLGENDSQKAKNVEKYNEDKHYKTAEEALKDESSKIPVKDNELQRLPDENILLTYHNNDGDNEAEHSKCGRESKMRSNKENPSESMINTTKLLHVDVVVQAFVDYLVQTVEAGFPVDVVASDNKDLVLDPSRKQEGHVGEGHPDDIDVVGDDDEDDEEVIGREIQDGSKMVRPDDIDAVGNDDDKNDEEVIGREIQDGSKVVHPDDIDVVGEDDDKNDEEVIGREIQDGNKVGLPDDIDVVGDDDKNDEVVLGREIQDGSKMVRPDNIDVVGDDDKNDEVVLGREIQDGSKVGLPDDIDVVGDDKNDEVVLGREIQDGSKMVLSDNIDVVGDDDDKNDKEVIGPEIQDGIKLVHPDDIDVVGDDDKNNEEVLGREIKDGSKMVRPGDIDVVGHDENDNEVLGREIKDGSKMVRPGDIDVVGHDENDNEVLGCEIKDGSKMVRPGDIDVVGHDENDNEVLGCEIKDGSKMVRPGDIDVVGHDENDNEVLGCETQDGSKMVHPGDIDVVGDDDGDINVEDLGDEVFTDSKADLSDANVTGDEDINLKNLGGNEINADDKPDLSDDIDAVRDDDHPTVVGNSLQPEHAANVGEDGNVEYSKRNANDCNIPSDIDATSNFNKENHVTLTNPHDRESAEKIGTKTSPSETRKSSFKNKTTTDTIGSTAPSQMDVVVTGISSADGRITSMKEETHGASLEELEVPAVECSKILLETLDKDKDKGTRNQEKSEKRKCDKQDKSLIIPEKESSVVNKDCTTSSTAVSKCGGEMDIDYVIDCTDSQLIGAKPNNVSDGLRYDDLNLEDLMDCTDSQLVDIETQVSNNQQSRDGVSQGLMIEDGTALVQDLIREISSIKLYLMDTWNRYEQVRKRRYLAYTPVIKKRK